MGVRQKVDQHLLDASHIDGHLRQIAVGLDLENLFLLARPRFDQHRAGIDQLAQAVNLGRQREGTALDFRNVENIGNDVEQMPPGAGDVLGILGGFLRRLAGGGDVLDELRKADDRIERRAQLMAHIGEKLGLGAAGRIGFDLGRAQRGFRPVARHQLTEVGRIFRQQRFPPPGRYVSVAMHGASWNPGQRNIEPQYGAGHLARR